MRQRCLLPVLWDRKTGAIVNNESSEIIRMLNREFAAFSDGATDYYPGDLTQEIDAVNERIYRDVNNGVYRCGFAVRQEPYDEAARNRFATLDWIDARLSRQTYLLAERLTELGLSCVGTQGDVARFLQLDGVFAPALARNPLLRHALERAYVRLADPLAALPA
jgi:glutathionyl-hydroquinone reductase